MILYKYMPLARMDFWLTFLLRFTQPSAFNDPFDCLPAYSFLPDSLMPQNSGYGELGSLFMGIENETVNFNDDHAVFCMSEAWNSILMWAHYILRSLDNSCIHDNHAASHFCLRTLTNHWQLSFAHKGDTLPYVRASPLFLGSAQETQKVRRGATVGRTWQPCARENYTASYGGKRQSERGFEYGIRLQGYWTDYWVHPGTTRNVTGSTLRTGRCRT